MSNLSDRLLRTPVYVAHEVLGLTPNQISVCSLIVALAAAAGIATGHLFGGFVLLAVSQILDGVDGGVARIYRLQSEEGKRIDMMFDRVSECAVFLALAWRGFVSYELVVLALIAILLITLQEPFTGFDPGFKRFVLYFGYLVSATTSLNGFSIAMNVIFFANLAGFAAGTILADYRLQMEIDAEAMIRREIEIAAGIPRPPDDPPSLLSRIFS